MVHSIRDLWSPFFIVIYELWRILSKSILKALFSWNVWNLKYEGWK